MHGLEWTELTYQRILAATALSMSIRSAFDVSCSSFVPANEIFRLPLRDNPDRSDVPFFSAIDRSLAQSCDTHLPQIGSSVLIGWPSKRHPYRRVRHTSQDPRQLAPSKRD